jgi:hypothetical protein
MHSAIQSLVCYMQVCHHQRRIRERGGWPGGRVELGDTQSPDPNIQSDVLYSLSLMVCLDKDRCVSVYNIFEGT